MKRKSGRSLNAKKSRFSVTKEILRTALFTLLGCVVALALVVGGLSIWSPKTVANVAHSLGAEQIALDYDVLSYNKSQDINDLYDVVCECNSTKNYSEIVKYYETLSADENYGDFVAYVSEQNLAATDDYAVKISVANEDDYLKCAYVRALYKTDRKNDSLKFASSLFLNKHSIITDSYYWTLGAYIDELVADTSVSTEIKQNFLTYDINAGDDYSQVETLILNYYQNLEGCCSSNFSGNNPNVDRLGACLILNQALKVNASLQQINANIKVITSNDTLQSDFTAFATYLENFELGLFV